MAEPGIPPATLRIGGMTICGRSLTARQGKAVSISVARGVAARFATTGARLERLTLRLRASAIAHDGSVDPAAVSEGLGGRHG
jgi:hypothetical protein